ncbi:transcriptional regulator [Sinomicrobium pectinilyticum]|uniref:Transcriptional regulator n=1 Tax=Sinomicrobium pectinilyticum TaxID=1084421 RepID=A0A3N0EK05_SINP1|nr:transcriptional regulator [Sinomicrobium pectinilyticum]
MQDINQIVCNYIYTTWIKPWLAEGKKLAEFSRKHNIEAKVVRKITSPNGYRIPLETLDKLCEARGISLLSFFKDLEKYTNSQK